MGLLFLFCACSSSLAGFISAPLRVVLGNARTPSGVKWATL
jgi:hypothetical protein